MRFHLLACPNAQTTAEYELCGFNALTIRFARMLYKQGHTVYLYASEENEAPCTELVPVLSKADIQTLLNGVPYQAVWFHPTPLLWETQCGRAISAIAQRKQRGDFILSIGGSAHKPVFDKFAEDCFGVEYSIGYQGTFANYRVFESHAHRSFIQGLYKNNRGNYFDEVIPVPFEAETFPYKRYRSSPEYLAYVGRITESKGVALACQVAQAAGLPLKVVGHGSEDDIKKLIGLGAEYLGALPTKARNEVMAGARAVLCPTLYIEPFNCVAVEAQLCGTPVIASPWGGFTETIEHGHTGFRCSMFAEFVGACKEVSALDRSEIRARAVYRYSVEAIYPQYLRYFRRVAQLHGDGFYAGFPREKPSPTIPPPDLPKTS
jgi:glycosyltransferase involved in cell wall biosynthesis